ncbi:MAG TPA: hypothetical protein VGB18_00920 [Candidatus Thermoplasmatota archaeon]
MAIIILIPHAAASPITGDLTATALILDGRFDADARGAVAFAAWRQGETATSSLSINASMMTVNWTRIDGIRFGFVPSNPEAGLMSRWTRHSQGEQSHPASTLMAVPTGPYPRMLWVLGPETAGATSFDSGSARASTNQTWKLGTFSNPNAVATPELQQANFEHRVPDGEPVLSLDAPHETHWSGASIVYLWDFSLQVAQDDATTMYRSGTWTDNATGPNVAGGHAAAEVHHQLLRLTLNGSAAWTQSDGTFQLAAGQFDTHGDGEALILGGLGSFQDTSHVYPIRNEDVRLVGTFEAAIRTHSSPIALASSLVASSPPIGLAGYARSVPSSNDSLVWVISTCILLLVLAGLGVVWWRREAPLWGLDSTDKLARLVSRDPAKAERKLRARRRRHPQDSDAVVLHAQSYFQLGRNAQLLREYAPILRAGGSFAPVLAFVLAKASVRLKRNDDVLNYMEIAASDPGVKQQAMRDPEVQAFFYGRPRRAAEAVAGYA